jgi:hypothetical protein
LERWNSPIGQMMEFDIISFHNFSFGEQDFDIDKKYRLQYINLLAVAKT